MSQAKKTLVNILNENKTIKAEELQGIILQMRLVWASDLDEWIATLRKKGAVTVQGMGERAKVLNRNHKLETNTTISTEQLDFYL